MSGFRGLLLLLSSLLISSALLAQVTGPGNTQSIDAASGPSPGDPCTAAEVKTAWVVRDTGDIYACIAGTLQWTVINASSVLSGDLTLNNLHLNGWLEVDGTTTLASELTVQAPISIVSENVPAGHELTIGLQACEAASASASWYIPECVSPPASERVGTVRLDTSGWFNFTGPGGEVGIGPTLGQLKVPADIYMPDGELRLASTTQASATCLDHDTDKLYGDKDCDGIKDAGEEYLDSLGSPPVGGDNAIQTDDGASAFDGDQTFTYNAATGYFEIAPIDLAATLRLSSEVSVGAGEDVAFLMERDGATFMYTEMIHGGRGWRTHLTGSGNPRRDLAIIEMDGVDPDGLERMTFFDNNRIGVFGNQRPFNVTTAPEGSGMFMVVNDTDNMVPSFESVLFDTGTGGGVGYKLTGQSQPQANLGYSVGAGTSGAYLHLYNHPSGAVQIVLDANDGATSRISNGPLQLDDYLRLGELGTDPTQTPNYGEIYTLDNGGETELWYQNTTDAYPLVSAGGGGLDPLVLTAGTAPTGEGGKVKLWANIGAGTSWPMATTSAGGHEPLASLGRCGSIDYTGDPFVTVDQCGGLPYYVFEDGLVVGASDGVGGVPSVIFDGFAGASISWSDAESAFLMGPLVTSQGLTIEETEGDVEGYEFITERANTTYVGGATVAASVQTLHPNTDSGDAYVLIRTGEQAGHVSVTCTFANIEIGSSAITLDDQDESDFGGAGPVTLTESSEWTASTDDATTCASLASAINTALSSVMTAASVSGVATITDDASSGSYSRSWDWTLTSNDADGLVIGNTAANPSDCTGSDCWQGGRDFTQMLQGQAASPSIVELGDPNTSAGGYVHGWPETLRVGRGVTEDITISAWTAYANKPYLSHSGGEWVYSNDGAVEFDMIDSASVVAWTDKHTFGTKYVTAGGEIDLWAVTELVVQEPDATANETDTWNFMSYAGNADAGDQYSFLFTVMGLPEKAWAVEEGASFNKAAEIIGDGTMYISKGNAVDYVWTNDLEEVATLGDVQAFTEQQTFYDDSQAMDSILIGDATDTGIKAVIFQNLSALGYVYLGSSDDNLHIVSSAGDVRLEDDVVVTGSTTVNLDCSASFLSTTAGGVLECKAGGGGGEVNTASNVGTDGVGVWYQKTVADLEFRHVAPGSTKITTTLVGQDIDIDVVEANLAHDHDGVTGGGTVDHVDLANKGTNTHAQVDTHLGSSSNPHTVTCAQATGCVTGAITGTGVTYENLSANGDIGFSAAQVPQGSLTAPLSSPALTDTPTAPTAAASTDTAQIATTAFVKDQEQTVCKTIESLVAADDNVPLFYFNGASTVVSIGCDSSAAATVNVQDHGGTQVDADLVCSTSGTITWDSSLSGTTAFTNGEKIQIDTVSESTPTWTTICIVYTTP